MDGAVLAGSVSRVTDGTQERRHRLLALPAVRGLGLLRGYLLRSVIAIAALLLATAATLVGPQFLRIAIDEGIFAERHRTIVMAALGLVGIAILRGVLNFAHHWHAEWISQYVAGDLREQLYAQVGRLGAGYHDRVHSADLMTRLTSDVENIRVFLGVAFIQFVTSAIALLATSVILLWMHPLLAIVSLIPLVLALVVLTISQRRLSGLYSDARSLTSRLNIRLHEALLGMRVIRAYSRSDYERERYDGANDDYVRANLAIIRTMAIQFPLYVFFANLGTLAAFWLGGWKVIDGELSVGELVAFNAYLGFLLFPAINIAAQANTISRANASLSRVFEVLDAPWEIRDAPNAVSLASVDGEVRFDDVWFRYPGRDRDVLRGVSLTIRAGERVAIVGPNGAGKSTLVSLLPRFYDVGLGSVSLDGHDVRQLRIADLRRHVGVVLQSPVLFRGTVRDNLTYGLPDASAVDVLAAARAAQVDRFVADLPQGYDTVIGERGVGLSGGQRQRIAIARTLLLRPRVLILDESMAAVDAETEAAIHTALEEMICEQAMTTITIAHRLSTVRDADRVIVVEDGQITAVGTHDELLADRTYRQLMALELSAD